MSRCTVICSPGSAAHDLPGHPECEARLATARGGVPADARIVTAEPALEDDIALVHDRAYIGTVQEKCRSVATFGFLDPDTYCTPASFRVAAAAAGCAMAAAEHALSGGHAFALIRPPGHHALPGRAMGFCIFNNAAIAAAAFRKEAGRVAIVDWDYHHGNGTQAAFYRSGSVLYCSVHDGGAFPFTGGTAEAGTGPGAGTTINAPLACGAALADYRLVFSDVFCPAIRRFDPEIIIVSAGQDILSDDPLGRMAMHPEDLGVLVHLLRRSSAAPLALVLEGGYGPSHGLAVAHILGALSEKTPEKSATGMPPPQPDTCGLVATLRAIHRL